MTRRRLLPLIAAFSVAVAPATAGASPESGLRKSLARAYAQAGSHASVLVRRASDRQRLFARKEGTARILASNTKLFTTAAALARYGPDGKLATRVVARAPVWSSGKLNGNLFLVGGGDPTFASRDFARDEYGSTSGGTVEKLADRLYAAGLRRLEGTVVGDESLFDSRRSGPAEGYAASAEVGGPLTALAYNHGLMSNGYFQRDPPSYAAARMVSALRSRGISVKDRKGRAGAAPDGARQLASVRSLPMATIARLTAQPSDNFFAELLAKGMGGGTTAGGADAIERFAAGARDTTVHLSDGSGLSRADKTSPFQIVRFVRNELESEDGAPFEAELPTAGETGTLADRMESGPARGHCHAKTGTLYGVSALSGYCDARGGSRLIFSILMNDVASDDDAHDVQDKMAQSMANYGG